VSMFKKELQSHNDNNTFILLCIECETAYIFVESKVSKWIKEQIIKPYTDKGNFWTLG